MFSLDKFNANYMPSSQRVSGEDSFNCSSIEINFIISQLGGRSFNHGLFRVLSGSQIVKITKALETGFSDYSGKIIPFAFDWLGRYFALDTSAADSGTSRILLFEPGAGEVMVIPGSIDEFFNIELIDYPDDVLAKQFWLAWRKINSNELAFSECVGYKIPLFLGGEDVLDNLEIIDVDVYVEICGQLKNRVRKLDAKQTIRSISIN